MAGVSHSPSFIPWNIVEDGCITISDSIESVVYHPSSNVILLSSKSGIVRAVDATYGDIFHTCDLSANAENGVRCTYLPSQDRVVFISDRAIGARRDLNGVLLLESVLQTAVSKPDDVVCVELPLPDAIHLCCYLRTAELPGVDYVSEVLQELERQIDMVVKRDKKSSHKATKWSTVSLKMPHSSLKTAFGGMLAELKRLQQKLPALPVVAAVNDRLSYLLPNVSGPNDAAASGGVVDRALMYSESARRETFAKWPHGNYKWALPEPMAQAGFYYQPSSSGDDRAMCFTCNVCLVCWEPTDEPWSEHERHSPQCPFVKGEFTHNVPLSVTYATEPAQLHGQTTDKIECVSTTTSQRFMATSTLHGSVVIWNVDTQLKRHHSLKVDASDSVIINKLGIVSSIKTAKEKSCSNVSSTTDTQLPIPRAESDSLATGAESSVADVYVTALSVLADPRPPIGGMWHELYSAWPCLVVGSLVKANFMADDTVDKSASNACSELDKPSSADWSVLDNDVQVLNRLNVALSGANTVGQQIISGEETTTVPASSKSATCCLLVYGIPTDQTAPALTSSIVDIKQNTHLVSSLAASVVTSGGGGGSSNIGSMATADLYAVKDMDMLSDDDFDVQIIGITPPAPHLPKASVGMQDGAIGSSGAATKATASMPENTESSGSQATGDSTGKVIQCIRLPFREQYISCIQPSHDGQLVFVATVAVSAYKHFEKSAKSCVDSVGQEVHGCLLVYCAKVESGKTLLDETPVVISTVASADDAVKSACLLPSDAGLSDDGDAAAKNGYSQGLVAVVTLSGLIQILSLAELTVLTTISGDSYTSVLYCNGVDRLCAVTSNNKIKFLSLHQSDLALQQQPDQLVDDVDGRSVFAAASTNISGVQVIGSGTSSPAPTDIKNHPDATLLLVDRPLTTEVLLALYELTKFENLQPRFNATVPPCWSEIQQEQQQRKHPQHLHQQHGDTSQHTRTWRLQPDSTSWDEHLFELILPTPCNIGHIDVKFSLNSLCTTMPHIEVTLLEQHVNTVKPGSFTNCADSANNVPGSDVRGGSYDSDFQTGTKSKHLGSQTSKHVTDLSAAQGAEIICGPVELAKYVDLSGTQGIIPLTSVKLLKAKSKLFLLHLKACKPSREKGSDKAPTNMQTGETASAEKLKTSVGASKWPVGGPSSLSSNEQPGTSTSKPSRCDNMRGCDWLQELSVTVRKFQRTKVPSERLQRFAMLESETFHKRLLVAACGHDDVSSGGTTSKEHRQQLALDILCWIIAVHMNDFSASHSGQAESDPTNLLITIQFNLSSLIQCCLLYGDRSIAYKCAKLVALCLEYIKNMTSDSDLALAFNYSLLHSLLDSLPLTLSASSAGAVQWFFTLLNHVKCLDTSATAQCCTELLGAVAQQYHTGGSQNTHHALLRSRYGLYGCPLEAELFDIDPPPVHTVPASSSVAAGSSYASIVASGIGPSGIGAGVSGGPVGMGGVPNVPSSSSIPNPQPFNEDVMFKDVMNLCWTDSKQPPDVQMGRYLSGLLEVEPLHFTCHATSDGTRMERVDAASQMAVLQTGATGLSGTINFGESLTSGIGALASLSTAMASAEQQLQQLQQKQLQLIKLQQQKQKLVQKLSETSKSSSAAVSLPHYVPYTSELFPPTPKNTPFFMTPPVTPPNESFHVIVGGGQMADAPVSNSISTMADKPPVAPSKLNIGSGSVSSKKDKQSVGTAGGGPVPMKPMLLWPQSHTLFQPPPPQALVIERMHSGARRFVVLDFGKPIQLTDIVIPMCGDLASLSIDVWVESEEVDGHRLVVSMDIGVSSLVMNNIMPAPVCRYLKVTTIRRYGGNTTRSRIPIGSFYGHTFIMPWERNVVPVASPLLSVPGGVIDGDDATTLSDQAIILSQLNVYMALLEEVQCRYSLACKNLTSLLSSVDVGSSSSQYFFKRGKRTDEDTRIIQTYNECCQLQIQFNLAKRAIVRLQKVLGIHPNYSCNHVADGPGGGASDPNLTQMLLQQASTDKLRVIAEFLLDTLLGMTVCGPTIPQIPVALYEAFTPAFAALLFRSLCVHGTRKTQTHAGVLLVRVCSSQPWWGEFLGNMLEEFFSSDQTVSAFPQDRVFILLAALGQRSLTSITASSILESILTLLARLLSPITASTRPSRDQESESGCLDLSLVGWVLLFLGKSLDSIRLSGADDGDRGGKDREGYCSRWNFVQVESGLQGSKLSLRSASSSKLYRRKLQKRLMHHKQQLLDLQQAKKHFMTSQLEKTSTGAMIDKEMEHIIKTQELMFKKQLKQYSSKHLKDIISLRRTDGELLRRMPKSDASVNGNGQLNRNGNDLAWDEVETALVVSRDVCLPVIHGLVVLLLSMDFTCHVDLFIISCKVLARLMNSTRPSVSLSEAVNMDELEKLFLLTCNFEYNHGNVTWGGSWAGHAITCLLQDILEGERMFMPASACDYASADNDMNAAAAAAASVMTDMDDSLHHSCTLPSVDDDTQDLTAPDSMQTKPLLANSSAKYDIDEMSMLVDVFMDDELSDSEPSLAGPVPMSSNNLDSISKALVDIPTDSVSGSAAAASGSKVNLSAASSKPPKYVAVYSVPNSNTIHWGPSIGGIFGPDDKKEAYKAWKVKLTNLSCSNANKIANLASNGISMAVDSRLESGIELCAELRLKVMMSVEFNNIQLAMNTPLPPAPTTGCAAPSSKGTSLHSHLDEQDANSIFRIEKPRTPTLDMLSLCFSNLFTRLSQGSINLEALLQMWLTLNDDNISLSLAAETNGTLMMSFDTNRIPSISLTMSAVSGLLAALAVMPSIPLRVWVLAFQTLSLVCNLRCYDGACSATSAGVSEQWLATGLINNPNLDLILKKFLTDAPAAASVHSISVGPAVVQAFHNFLVRLQIRCTDDAEIQLKQLLLRLVCNLSAETGAFYLCTGPLDAQCRLLDDIIEFGIANHVAVDTNVALSIIDSVALLVHRHINAQEQVSCRSSLEPVMNARSCFGGLFTGMLRGADTARRSALTADTSRDQLMSSLLRLTSILLRLPLPAAQKRQSTAPPASTSTTSHYRTSHADTEVAAASEAKMRKEQHTSEGSLVSSVIDSPHAELNGLSQSVGTSGNVMTSTPNFSTDAVATDEQKTSTTMGAATATIVTASPLAPPPPVMSMRWQRRVCTHDPAGSHPPSLADIVIRNRQIMAYLFEALSGCNSSAIAMIFASSGLPTCASYLEDSIPGTGSSASDCSSSLSVGDGVYQVMLILNSTVSDLNLMILPLYEYLVGELRSQNATRRISHLSEPLLWFILRVLDCSRAIRNFLDLGGVNIVCENLVSTNRHIINTSPSIVSSIMQYFGSARMTNSSSRRNGGQFSDSSQDIALQNFAPLGTITSSSPSAGPADVLIQGAPLHRRARTAAWSYHFYPDEAWVDLTIVLPCAVLLKEIIIQPHLSSLATCPSTVAIEGSRDGSAAGMVPLCTPVSTSGLTTIKIQMLRDEIVTAVLIRLHKPRDSQTIGLSHIMLMGYMAFSDMSGSAASRIANVHAPMEDYVSRTSIGWLRLLHHCLTHCEELREDVTKSIAPTADLLLTCTTLLMSTSAILYSSNIESVLLTLGLHSTSLGLSLIEHILRYTAFRSDEGRLVYPHGKVHGKATESTVDILYRLGTHQDDGLQLRIKALLDWVGDSAHAAIQKWSNANAQAGTSGDGVPDRAQARLSPVSIPAPAVAHVHAVAAILWKSKEMGDNFLTKEMVSKELLSCVYEWSQLLAVDTPLRRAVDWVLCSICHIRPEFFMQLLQWMGVYTDLSQIDSASDVLPTTDDIKDSQQNQPLTDDVKADSGASSGGQRLSFSYNSVINSLDESRLLTLSVACQSPFAMRQLIDSGVVSGLCSLLSASAQRKLSNIFDMEPVIGSSEAVPTVSSSKVWMDLTGLSSSKPSSSSQRQSVSSERSSPFLSHSGGQAMKAELIAPTLHFLADISRDTFVKNWLGQPENCTFWGVLLTSLCTPVSTCMLIGSASPTLASSKQQLAIETAAIEFFNNVTSCHTRNQLTFSRVLCEIIQSQKNSVPGCTSTISGFLRRLFLPVLLEDERVLVCIKSTQPMYKNQSAIGMANRLQHVHHGIGHCYRCLQFSINATFGEILSKITELPASSSSGDDQHKVTDDLHKDASELGIEVIEQIATVAGTGIKAKEKRDKDKTSTVSSSSSSLRPPSRRGTRTGDHSSQHAYSCLTSSYDPSNTDRPLPTDMTISQLLQQLYERGLATPGETCLNLNLKFTTQSPSSMQAAAAAESRERHNSGVAAESADFTSQLPALTSSLQIFSSVGGLALLAEHLPLLYPEFTRQSTPVDVSHDPATGMGIGSNVSGFGHDWVTVESAEEIYEEIYEPPAPSSPPSQQKPSTTQVLSIPPHSLVAFGLFLRLPGYAEVLLKEKCKAQCLLRLILGVTDDGDGGHILMSPFASELPTLPFFVLKSLFDMSPLTTDDGVVLRRMALDIGAVHLILACLSVLGHHAPRQTISGFHQEFIAAATQATAMNTSTGISQQKSSTEEKAQSYWAKGTGFGTGSTTSSWDAEQALLRQKTEEEHVTCFLKVLASYIKPSRSVSKEAANVSSAEASQDKTGSDQTSLPALLPELLSQSCLIPALSSYLRNDSVLDMACHVPLYRALLELLRAIALCPSLMPLLLPLDKDDDSTVSVSCLLDKMKQCVDTYASRLKGGGKINSKSPRHRQVSEDEESEGLALLIPDIQETAHIVNMAISRILDKSDDESSSGASLTKHKADCPGIAGRLNHSEEERYISVMKELQFDTYKMVLDDASSVRFVVPHHYESNVKAAGDINNAARARRLAQEAVTLSTSLPLSAGSSVFVRCDEERLDIMKVLMTGPSDTPYANGCFEFDVYFPVDYPNSPPLINLETTGNHTVRFNPNLYNDGKVCLSVLNTWHGRPEEKWNSQTSSFLQVLVSIQSLILVSEPYFNEPGYERSRGTPSGTASSREYDANIRQATTKWAMLEMLRNPPACFKQVVEWHFWLKKNEILAQLEEWIADLEMNSNDKRVGRSISHSCTSIKRHYSQLKDELVKLKPPASFSATDSSELSSLASPADITNTSCQNAETALATDDISKPQNSSAEVVTVSSVPIDSVTVSLSVHSGVANVAVALDNATDDDLIDNENNNLHAFV